MFVNLGKRLDRSDGHSQKEQLVVLTHNHDVCVGQKGSVSVGGLTLIDCTVRHFGILQNDGIIKYPPVGCWGL